MKTLLLAAFLLSTQAHAALPPYWDSVRRIDAVMNSAVSAKLSGAITQVKSLGNLKFEVDTDFCDAKVTLKAIPPGRPGPTSYELQSIDSVVCEFD
ncbi:MAG: hypothetical protein ACXWQO_02155 [Bdellovibrionota bacterium]